MKFQLKEPLPVGTKCGQWEIIKPIEKIKDRYYYTCKCECGTEKPVYKTSIDNGTSTRCSLCVAKASRLKVEVGDVYNCWTVTEVLPNVKFEDTKCKCECVCGNKETKPVYQLKASRSKKCEKCYVLNEKIPVFKLMWSIILKNAKKRDLPVEVTIQDIIKLIEDQKYICALSGETLEIAETTTQHYAGKTSASLDRKDSKLGYIPGNIQWVRKQVNMLKNNYTDDQFIKMCIEVSEFQQNKKILSLPPGTLSVF
jgi:hypothetical protein